MRNLAYAVAVAAVVLLTAGCSESDKVKARQETREAGAKIRQGAHEVGQKIDQALTPSPEQRAANAERQAYDEQMRTRLDRIDTDLAQLEAKQENATGRRKAQLETRIAALKVERDAVRDRYGKLHSATDDAWPDLKSALDKAARKLEDGYQRLKAELKS